IAGCNDKQYVVRCYQIDFIQKRLAETAASPTVAGNANIRIGPEDGFDLDQEFERGNSVYCRAASAAQKFAADNRRDTIDAGNSEAIVTSGADDPGHMGSVADIIERITCSRDGVKAVRSFCTSDRLSVDVHCERSRRRPDIGHEIRMFVIDSGI